MSSLIDMVAQTAAKNEAEAQRQKAEQEPATQTPVENKEDIKVDDSQSASPDGDTVVPEPPESQVTPEAVEVTTEQEPEETPWDADNKTVEETPSKQFDFGKLGGALGWGEVKDESDFLTKAQEHQTRFKELQEKPLSGIPEELREVIEIARTTPEAWKDYARNQTFDYSKVDPIALYAEEFNRDAVKNPQYFDENGKFSDELADQGWKEIPDTLKRMTGLQIQQSLVQQQKSRQVEIRAKAEARLANADNSLVAATQKLAEILPYESYGVKFEPKHASEIYKGITDSSLTKKHLGVSYETLVQQGVDMSRVARTITLAEKADKMVQYSSKTAEARAKKALLDKTQNAQIQRPGNPVAPSAPDKKVMSPADKIAWHLEQAKKNDFFN